MAEANPQKVIDTLTAPIVRALDGQGITISYLARKLKSELNAREVKTFKAKVVKPLDPQDPKSPTVETEEVIYSNSLIAWDTRQKARMDAHHLRGDYPPEKKQVGGLNGEPIRVILEDMSKKKAADPGDALAPVEKELIG